MMDLGFPVVRHLSTTRLESIQAGTDLSHVQAVTSAFCWLDLRKCSLSVTVVYGDS